MATALAIASSSSIPNITTLTSSSCFNSNSSYLSLPTRSYPCLQTTPKKINFFHHPSTLITLKPRNNSLGTISPPSAAASAEDIDTAQQLVSTTGDGGVSTVVSALLFAAFIGLSILTIGVIYLGVTDFLQKREKDKFEKEEAANKGKKKKKKVVRARAGPRGFGQKFDQEEDDD
ncbi:hypothetical protein TanjilG_11329 [Lupinus angustifolius]|uniref:Transmembrane protein n=1 Tax=Lupinus angustifolius TaxID=3871 RepID=A0A1J7H8G8_LUPAN|nr:PREDICTED: uncharacterized protein LOC109351084 [Lupinus angustifolius]OIW09191.1 hypothetical protein TanjilG_11329 [Lupinus angustifolius]